MSAPLSLLNRRYIQQARWSASVRRYFFEQTRCRPRRALDVGCGTGALFPEMAKHTSFLVGIDHSLPALRIASYDSALCQADALCLPFANHTFDLVFCHYVLLWLRQSSFHALNEMRRVCVPGGWIAAFAEPDHAARIDHPPNLEALGKLQTQALIAQGIDPLAGRKLNTAMQAAGFLHITVGILGAEWQPGHSSMEDLETDILESDLQPWSSAATIDALLLADRSARRSGERILFVPTFFAWGQTPT